MLSLMEAQAQFFQHGHQSLSELDEYRRKLNEEVIVLFVCLIDSVSFATIAFAPQIL